MNEAARRDIEAVRLAKERLAAKYAGRPWLRGVGIAPSPTGFALRLNVDPDGAPPRAELPEVFEGVPVEVVAIRSYAPRPG